MTPAFHRSALGHLTQAMVETGRTALADDEVLGVRVRKGGIVKPYFYGAHLDVDASVREVKPVTMVTVRPDKSVTVRVTAGQRWK